MEEAIFEPTTNPLIVYTLIADSYKIILKKIWLEPSNGSLLAIHMISLSSLDDVFLGQAFLGTFSIVPCLLFRVKKNL
jgi:hypothetical protein